MHSSTESFFWKKAVNIAKNRGNNLIIFMGQQLNSSYRYTKEENIIYNMIQGEIVDGLILSTGTIIPSNGEGFDNFLSRFSKIPTVSLSVALKDKCSVIIDNKEGMKRAIEHLIKIHNYKRIAFIKGPELHDEAIFRYEAYKEVLSENSIEFDALLVVPGSFFNSSGIEAVKKLAKLDLLDIDAIVCVNDDTALGVIEELKNRDYNVPDDIAVVGFDNINGVESTLPPLSTVDQPSNELIKSAYNKILNLINKKPVDKLESIPANFIIRESCGCQPYSFEIATNPYPKEIASEMLEFCSDLKDKIYNSEINGINDTHFLKILKDKVTSVLLEKHLKVDWQILLMRIQKEVIMDIDDNKLHLQLIELFAKAQRVVTDLLLHHQNLLTHIQIEKDVIHRELKQDLNSVDNLNDLTNVVIQYLDKIGMNEGYLALYNTQPNKTGLFGWEMPEISELVISYNKGKTHFTPKNSKKFYTKKILPDELFNNQDCYQYSISAIYEREQQFGYLVLSTNIEDSSYYILLQEYICSTISRIFEREQRLKLEKQIDETLEQLKASNSQLTQLDDLKNDFIANITHDFRSPLSIILNSADIAMKYENKGDSGRVQNRLETIYNASIKLKRAIDRLLDLAKMDTEGLKLNIHRVKPKYFITQLIDFYRSSIVSSQIKILDSLPASEIDNFYSDKDKLEEILSNIISNSLKYISTDTGEIIISLINLEDFIQIEIEDNGIGIDKENLENIFKRFEQVESGRDSIYHGNGLGLAFSKQLSGYLKGAIHAESEGLGLGSKFVLTFPKGKNNFDKKDIVEEPINQKDFQFTEVLKEGLMSNLSEGDSQIKIHFTNLNKQDEFEYKKGVILIVEDNMDIRDIECSYLLNNGYFNVITAVDGHEGIEAAYKYRPDLILCDYNMPNMKGDRFHDDLINNPDFKKVPVIFVTALADRSILIDRQRKGAVAHLSKPIDAEEFITLTDIHMKKYMEYKEILIQATTDELTGLNNRRTVLRLFREKLAIRKINSFSLIFFDIDHFKTVNDTYGHRAGDVILKTLGTCLKENLRPYDIAGRYGGEEFIILLTDTNRFQASIVTDKIRNLFSDMEIIFANKALKFTASFGIASLLDDSEYICNKLNINNLSEIYEVLDNENADWSYIEDKKLELVDLLIEMADKALYHAKSTTCEKCGYSSEKSEIFKDNCCPKCTYNKLIPGRNKFVCFNGVLHSR